MSTMTVSAPRPQQVRRARPVPARPCAPAPSTPAAAGHGVRLTRRGRLVVVVGLAVLLFAAFSLGRVGAEGSTSAAPELQTVVVAPGETLWEIATRVAPGQDPRPVVDQIRSLNALSGGELRVGQPLVLPAAG